MEFLMKNERECCDPSVQILTPHPEFLSTSGDRKSIGDVGWFWFNFRFGTERDRNVEKLVEDLSIHL